jgi:hypothetical protein
MIGRRALLAAGLSFPLAAHASSPWKGYYASGTHQRAVRFAGGDGATLAGTLLLPLWSELQKVPGIVLVAGSGPTDRDGNNPLTPERTDVLKRIAELLATAGIATLRYDKRGIGGSTQRPRGTLEEQERFFAWDNFVGDVAAAHGELVKHDEIKSYATALLGHSEGGLLVLAAVPSIGKNRPHGMVLASTPGRPMREIVRAQVARGAPHLRSGAGAARPRPRLPAAAGRRGSSGRADGGRAAADRCARQARCAWRSGDPPRGQPQSQAHELAERFRFRRTDRARRRRQAGRLARADAGCLIGRTSGSIIAVRMEDATWR